MVQTLTERSLMRHFKLQSIQDAYGQTSGCCSICCVKLKGSAIYPTQDGYAACIQHVSLFGGYTTLESLFKDRQKITFLVPTLVCEEDCICAMCKTKIPIGDLVLHIQYSSNQSMHKKDFCSHGCAHAYTKKKVRHD